ncbi:MAG: glycosyltransferase family 8 protein [Methylobacteriaceae bacterium]|nr:glycosyltransferase family 8 protein [Methylobacteriaceae bacterium]
MTAKTTIHVLFCIDRGYVAQAGVAIASLVASNPESALEISIASFDPLLDASERIFASASRRHPDCRIRCYHLDEGAFADLPTTQRFSTSIYTRIILDRFIDSQQTRVLYLDADTLICADLRPLWNEPLDGKVMGVVRDHFRLDGEQIGFGPDTPYFNSGVLLIDMAAWRAARCEERVLDYLARHGQSLPWMDQDALNVALRDEVKFLDLAWNFQPRCADVPARFLGLSDADYAALRASPKLIHYTTSLKPWVAAHRVHYSERYLAAARAAGLLDELRPPRIRGARDRVQHLKTRLRWRYPRLFRALRRVVRPEAAALMYRARAEA